MIGCTQIFSLGLPILSIWTKTTFFPFEINASYHIIEVFFE